MFSAIFVMLIISMLAIQFHKMSREAQSNAFKFQAAEVARQLAESAIEEAFAYISNEAGKTTSTLHLQIANNHSSPSALDCTTGNLKDKNSKGVVIPVPLTENVATSMTIGNRFDISVTARIIDFRNQDPNGRKYYRNEGVGTLEIRVRVGPKEKYKKTIRGACTITRHHDYKVVSIVSNKSNRHAAYVHNRILDYALFISRGYEEFVNYNGSNLNPQNTKLTIDQTGLNPAAPQMYGKVFLGGTSGMSGKPVFIDVTEDTASLIPTPLKKDKITPPSPLDNPQCLSLLPGLYPLFNQASKEAFDEEVAKQGHTGDAKYKSCQIGKLKGNFYFEKHPVTDTAIDAITTLTDEQKKDLKAARKGAWQGDKICFSPKDPNLPFKPGLKILPMDQMSNILRGKIRKRFFHFGYFVLDMTEAELTIFYKKKKKKTFGWKWVDAAEGPTPLNNPDLIAKYNARRIPVYPYIDSLVGGELNLAYVRDNFNYKEIKSVMNSDYDYKEGEDTDTFSNPEFYKFTDTMSLDGSDLSVNEFRPFSHASLWYRKDFPASKLGEFGILRNGKLYLHGIVRVSGKVTLKGKDGAPLEIHGKGILIADEISIESEIKKATPEDLCILAVRGADIEGVVSPQTIWVKTDAPIEASLVAVGYGHKCRVIPQNNTLNLKGALAVDVLDIDRWKKNTEHKVFYDPALCCDKDIYDVNISRWISFERVIEEDK